MGLYKSLCVVTAFNGSLCVLVGLYASLLVLMRSYTVGPDASIWILMGPYESNRSLYVFMGPYGF